MAFCPGYARGLALHGGFAVVGLSKPRGNKTFSGLELDEALRARDAEARCGLLVVDLRSGDAVHSLRLEGVVEELYDVAVLPGARRPTALGLKTDEIRRTLSVAPPAAALAVAPAGPAGLRRGSRWTALRGPVPLQAIGVRPDCVLGGATARRSPLPPAGNRAAARPVPIPRAWPGLAPSSGGCAARGGPCTPRAQPGPVGRRPGAPRGGAPPGGRRRLGRDST